LTFIGTKKLGYPEKEVGRMTLGKFTKLYREYKNDFDQELTMQLNKVRYCDLEKHEDLDDAIPF
jgi:hypothetical protein